MRRHKLPWEAIFLGAMILASLVPVWAPRYFCAQDGPSHVYSAQIIRDWFTGHRAAWQPWYQLDLRPLPNVLGHLILAPLTAMAPSATAEKLLVSLYAIALPLAARYAIRGIRPRAGILAILAFPLMFNRLLHMGFYNFSLGLVLMFVAIGYWLRRRDALTPRRIVTLATIALLIHLSHLTTSIATIGIIGVLALVLPKRPGHATVARRMLTTAIALLPATILAAVFAAQSAPTGDTEPVSTAATQLAALARLDTLISHNEHVSIPARILAAALVLSMLLLLIRKIRRHTWHGFDALLLLAVGLAALYASMVSMRAFALFLPDRLVVMLLCVLMLWLAAQSWPAMLRSSLCCLAGAVAIAMVALNTASMRTISAQLDDFVSAERSIQPGRTMLVLCYAPRGRDSAGQGLATRVGPFLHASSLIAARTGAIDLGHYEAAAPLFPVQFRPNLRAATRDHIHEWTDADIPAADLDKFESETHQTIDYILLWSPSAEQLSLPASQQIQRTLTARYRRITLDPNSRMQVYVRH